MSSRLIIRTAIAIMACKSQLKMTGSNQLDWNAGQKVATFLLLPLLLQSLPGRGSEGGGPEEGGSEGGSWPDEDAEAPAVGG